MTRVTRMLFLPIIVIGAIALLAVLEERAGVLSIGDRAPDFSGSLSTGERIALKQLLGTQAVVLFFYPKDSTSGCTEEVCAFRDGYSNIRNLDAVMFGISPDDSASHDRFIRRNNLPFSLITDSDRSISRVYGVVRLGGLIPLLKRVTYVIDRHGIIRGVFHHEILIDRHVDDVVKILEILRSE
jgi:peroxiredoxin Q/BCP